MSSVQESHKNISASREPCVAFLPWGNVIEDFLDTLGVSLDGFRREFVGSYMFGYIRALKRAGVRTLLVCISSRVDRVTRFVHEPTGAPVVVLPAPAVYRFLQPRMLNPYGRNVRQVFGEKHGARRLWFPLLAMLRETVLYMPNPVVRLAGELRRENCSAILCQEYEYPRFDACVMLGRMMRLPVFATFQGGDYQRNHLERFVRPVTMRSCSGLIIATGTEIERVRIRYGVPSSKIAQIFNPVDLDVWHPEDRLESRRALGVPANAEAVAWHGRISIDQKGLDVLLDAWEIVCRSRAGRDCRLLLVGSGKDEGELRRQIEARRLPGIIWHDRFVHDSAVTIRYLSAADLYAFPSRHEGFPVAPIEALACGLPLAAADAQGIPDILEGGEEDGGIMVHRENPDELAAAINRILDDDVLRRELGRRARRRVEEAFSLEAVGSQLRRFILDKEAVRRGPGSGIQQAELPRTDSSFAKRAGGA